VSHATLLAVRAVASRVAAGRMAALAIGKEKVVTMPAAEGIVKKALGGIAGARRGPLAHLRKALEGRGVIVKDGGGVRLNLSVLKNALKTLPKESREQFFRKVAAEAGLKSLKKAGLKSLEEADRIRVGEAITNLAARAAMVEKKLGVELDEKRFEAILGLGRAVQDAMGERNIFKFVEKYYTDPKFRRDADGVIMDLIRGGKEYEFLRGLPPHQIVSAYAEAKVQASSLRELAWQASKVVGAEVGKEVARDATLLLYAAGEWLMAAPSRAVLARFGVDDGMSFASAMRLSGHAPRAQVRVEDLEEQLALASQSGVRAA